MHQYAGTPSYPTDFTIPDDLDDIDAMSVDVAFEALGDRTAFLKERVDGLDVFIDALPALNWIGAQTVSVTSNWQSQAVYDPINVRWVAADGGGKVYASPDAVHSWTQLGSSTYGDGGPPGIIGVVVDELTGHVYVTGGGNIGDWSGSAWTNHSAYGGVGGFDTGIWFSNQAIFVGSPTVGGFIKTYTTAAGVGSPTAPGGMPTAPDWAMAASASLVIAVPCQLTGPGLTYIYSSDGVTWHTGTIPTLASELVFAKGSIGYGNGFFHVWAINSGSGYSTLYTSPDGLSWTSTKTLTGPQIQATANIITPSGVVWFAASHTTVNEGFFSVDDGATWGVAAAFHPGTVADVISVTTDGSTFIATQLTTTGMSRSLAINLPARS